MTHRLLPFAGVVAALSLLFVGVSSVGAQTPAAVAPPCPPVDDPPTEWIDLCIDRGEGATYQVGDPITICVTAYIPQPATAAPPPSQPGAVSPMPLPLVRVVNAVNGGPEHVIFEEAFAGGQRCITTSIVTPTGSEILRVDVVDQQNGQLIATDEVSFTSVGG